MVDNNSPKLSVIIPVYNEVNTIGDILTKILSERADVEIIVVDDGSCDGTSRKLNEFHSERIKIVSHPYNFGKGHAVISGLKIVTGDIVLIQDSDLEYNPQDYEKLLAPFLTKGAKVVYGMRLSKSHRMRHPGHYCGNKIISLLVWFLFRIWLEDVCTGYKVFRTDVIKSFEIRSRRFNFDAEITAKLLRNNYRIEEVPITYYCRKRSEGKKFGWLDRFITVYTICKYRFFD